MKTLLIDIETAPHRVYSWGLWNQNIAVNQIEEPGYTLSFAAKWYGSNDMQFNSIRGGKEQMLAHAYQLIDTADAVIHYNGNRFDMPTLNQEFLAQQWGPPSPVVNIDLLNTARRRFRLPSNSLNYVCNYLGLGAKTKHKGMELWRDCMAGNDKAWNTMEEYNKQDVVLLEAVYEKLKPWVPNHPNHALFTSNSDMVCPNCGSRHLQKRGSYYTKTMAYQRYHCQTCGAWSRSRKNNVSTEKKTAILVGIM